MLATVDGLASEYTRPVRNHNNKFKKKRPPPGAVKENEVKHPLHQPYKRHQRGQWLRLEELDLSDYEDGFGEG